MDQGVAAVFVAVITTIGGIVVGFMQLFRKESRAAVEENRKDHAVVQSQLYLIHRSIGKIDDKLESHLEQHAEGETDGNPKR